MEEENSMTATIAILQELAEFHEKKINEEIKEEEVYIPIINALLEKTLAEYKLHRSKELVIMLDEEHSDIAETIIARGSQRILRRVFGTAIVKLCFAKHSYFHVQLLQ
jgi:hypothetical protein